MPNDDQVSPRILAEVNQARSELGLEPLTAGLFHLSKEFLREKAEDQLRDALGRWRKQRGTLPTTEPDHQAGTPETRLAETPWHAHRRRKQAKATMAGRWAAQPLRPANAHKDVTHRHTPEAGRQRLIEAGFTEGEADYWNSRGVIYERPVAAGENPVFAFAATPDAMVETMLDLRKMMVRLDQNSILISELSLEHAIQGADPRRRAENLAEIERHKAQIRAKKARMARNIAELEKERERWEKFYGTGGRETIGITHQVVADDAAETLHQALLKSPRSRARDSRGKLLPYMVQLDHSDLVLDNGRFALGQTILGSTVLSIDMERYFTEPDATGWHVKAYSPYKGRGTVRHELGHMIDLPKEDPQSSERNQDVWQEAIRLGLMSEYGTDSPQEGYAEAYAQWLKEPTAPLAALYAERFGWADQAAAGSHGERIIHSRQQPAAN